jgi:hypothetical protein
VAKDRLSGPRRKPTESERAWRELKGEWARRDREAEKSKPKQEKKYFPIFPAKSRKPRFGERSTGIRSVVVNPVGNGKRQ